MSFIEVKHVNKTFRVSKRQKGLAGMAANLIHPRYEYRKAVADMNFSIEEGDMTGFIGPNGAGKSTMVKMLSGILHPDGGHILVSGYIPYKQRKDYVGNIGVVFGQKSQLQWDLPPIDTFELLKYIYKIPERQYKERLNRYVQMLDMEGFLEQPVRPRLDSGCVRTSWRRFCTRPGSCFSMSRPLGLMSWERKLFGNLSGN